MSAELRFPLRHLSIRVPWHDAAWNGTVCKQPRFNGACLKLARIADSRRDDAEEAVAGRSVKDLGRDQWPCCIGERATFMADFEFNRLVHNRFKDRTLAEARKEKFRKIPKPMGTECVVYGDKVINVRNHRRDGNKVYPAENATGYLANGEIGIVVGQWRTQNMTGPPKILKVEFSTQPGCTYDFYDNDFSDEGVPALELAYALTVHKAQGSEFDLVILVLPQRARLISRELLYTALTRQRKRIVVMHQGSLAGLQRYSSDYCSDTATRLTNLFVPPNPQPVRDRGARDERFLEDRLIHRTSRGEAVRSKSEVIIADQLAAQGISYSYELELELAGTVKYPDFTVEDEERGVTYFWEHCGMMFDPAYRRRWEEKLKWYRNNGIRLYNEEGASPKRLIVTQDDQRGGISSEEIAQLIRRIMG